ncbi:MAG: methionine adenosyltransferase domain-containing protein [Candidatus Pacebacteria bacterium]|nr:methionine adenosyltransferase domain-containing protein [Candidatus Paceibacterota bacterium]
MKKTNQVFTAEYVSPKHPDKMCDRISDAILEKFTNQDPNSRVAVETLGGHGKVFIVGEVTSSGTIKQSEYEQIVADITGVDSYEVIVHIVQQSSEIATGVNTGGAGDQGIVIGYACNHNKEMIPQEFYLAKSLCGYLYKKYPVDGKTQITINQKHEITHLVASFQGTKTHKLTKMIYQWLKSKKHIKEIKILINPAGEWSIGGFEADTGLTGRKIVIDQYGPRVAVGGGAFSGKDWTKVDRSGAKYAQYIAQQLLNQHNAKVVSVELAYAIGIVEPVQKIAYIDNVATEILEWDCSMNGIKEFRNTKHQEII